MTKTSGFFRGRPSACLRLAVVCLLPVLLATCGEDGPGGPSGSPVIGRVEFTSGPVMSGGYFGPNLPIDRVHILIVRPPNSTLRDTTRAFDPNLNRLRFELPVLLAAAAESLDVTLELLSGTTVLFSGTSRLEARAGPPSTAPPPAIPLIYSGPGSNIAQLSLSPLDSVLGQGDSLIMQVSGLDGSQQPVPSFYVGWSSSDTTVARVNGAGVVRGRVARGTVFIRAKTPDTQALPSGIVESTTVTLVPDPTTLIKVGGDNQSAALGTMLPQMLEVEVRAGDNLPVAGVQVAFATSDPGASVDSATGTTDANGVARTHAVLGPTVGAQSFTASVPGTTTVTFSATATAAPTPTWTGAVSIDWNDAGNWNTGAVPGGADSVTIPAGTPNSPDLTGNVSIAALLNNNVLNMAGFSLTLDGNLRGTGSISGSSNSNLFVSAPATVIDHANVTNLTVLGASLAVVRNMNVSGNLTVTGNPADLFLNGHTVTVNGDFATQGNGTLSMTNGPDTLRVLNDVLFNGGSTFSRISTGVILIGGDFTQQAGSSARSYAPTGNHLDAFIGTGVQTITFATPGSTGSNFETLGLANSVGGVTLASDLFLAGPVGFAPGVPRIAHGSGQTLFVAELRASNATLDNILVAANNVLLTQFDSINFINYSPTATPLTISHPGSATPFVMNDLSFGVTPTSGFYISATDLVADANALTLNLVNPTPAASGGFVRTQGGAVVNWPFVPAGARTWTGAIDTDWFKAGNWSPAAVPAATDDVVIPATATQPVLTFGAGVHNLTIQAGASLTAGGDVDVTGNAIVTGSFLGSAGIIVMSTHGTSVSGNISNLEIDLPSRFESILVSGPLNVSGLIEVLRGHLDVGGNTVTTADFATITDGILKMVNPSGTLIVNGNADFGGEDPTGVLTAGTIRVKGNFAQLVGVTQGSFVATGTNRVILDGTGPQVVTFVTPAANGSRFQDLEIANTSDTVFMGSNIFVNGALSELQANPVVIAGAGQLLTTNGVAMSGAAFHNARVDIQGSAITQFNSITWDAFSPFVTQFTVTLPNGVFQFDNHVFTTTPSTGFYLRAEDTNPSDGQPLTLNMASPTPAAPGAFVQIAGGAVVNWPAGPSPVNTWTGAVSTNWNTAGNWSTNAVPVPADSVIIPSGMPNNPTLTGRASVTSLVQNSQLTINGGTLEVARDMVGPFGANTMFTQSTDSLIVRDSLFQNVFGLAGGGGVLAVGGNIGSSFGGTPITVVLNGTGAQSWAQGVGTGVGLLKVRKPSGSVSFPVGVRVDSIDVNSAIPLTGNQLEIARGLFTAGDLTVTLSLTIGGQLTVQGAFSSTTTIFRPNSATTVDIPAYNYGSLRYEASTTSSVRLVGRTTVNGLFLVQGTNSGTFSLNGHTLDVSGSVLNNGFGSTKIVMTNPLDSLIVSGSVDFQAGVGPIPPANLTAGTLVIGGDFSQSNPFGGAPFQATGTHKTVFTGNNPAVVFASPGSGNNQNRFANMEWTGTGTMTLGGSTFVTGTLTTTGPTGTITSPGGTVFVGGVVTNGTTFNNTQPFVNGSGNLSLTNTTFQGFAPTTQQLAITHPGVATPFTFTNVTFSVTPTTGAYMVVIDADGASPDPLTIDMVNPSPGTPGSFVSASNGAVVNWPATAGGTRVWTGAINTDWFNPGNWSGGVVPTAADDVDFTQFFTNQPSIGTNTAIRNLSVSSGRVVTVQSGVTLSVHGDALINGTISGPGTVDLVGTSGSLVSGIFPNLRVSAPYTLGGTLEVHGTFLTIQSDLTVGANTITLFSNLNVIGSGRLIMTNPNALVGVQGFAIFDGASTVGTMTAGLLAVTNNFTQSATTSSNSFTASGSHLTVLNGAGSQVVTFASPTVSGFQGLQYNGTGSLTLGSDIRVLGAYTQVVPRVVSGAGRKLTTAGITITNGTFDHVLIEVNSTLGGALLSISNATFQNYPSTATQVSIVHPGSLGPAPFDGLTFSSTPTTGFYISATDQNPSDGLPLTINVTNTTPSSGSPFVQTAGGAIVNWPSGPTPVVTWTGAVDSDWSNPANWSTNAVPTFVDSVVIPAGGNQPSLTAPSFAGVLHLANGTLTLNGQALAVGTNFYSTGSGLLVMTNPNDGMSIGGDATFNGANELGSMSAGAIVLLGDLIQLATNSPDSYHPSGTHVTYFSGTTTQTISFATAGPNLQDVIWSGNADLVMASDVRVNGNFINIGSTARSISGSSRRVLAVNGFSNTLGGITFDNVWLFINQTTPTVLIVNNLTFVNQSPTGAQLQVGHPGDASTYVFNNLSFLTVPTTGVYLSVFDLSSGNGFPFTIDMVNPSPGTPGAFVQTVGGAVVNWPAAGGGSSSWTGAADSDWNNAANWQAGNIPNVTSDVSIPAGAPNYPSLVTSEVVHDMSVAPGGSVNFAGGSLDISGDLTGGGSMTNGGPMMTGTNALLVMNDLGDLVVNGTVNLGADLVITGDLTVTGAGANFNLGGSNLDVLGNLATLSQGTIQMTTAGANVVVGGAATFDGGPMNGMLTAGQIEFRGNFTQGNSSSQQSFRSGGTLVIFNGTAQQTITMSDSLLSFFSDLDLDNVGGGILLNSMVRVTGDLAIAANVQVTASDLSFTGTGLDVNGDVFSSAGSLLQLGRLYVQGNMSIAGSYNTTSIIYTGTGQVASSTLPYQFLYSRGSVTFAAGTPTIGTLTVEAGSLNLAGRTTVTGSVFILSGTLKPNGRTLAIGGALNVQNTGTLTMQNALDSVITGPAGAAIFSGGSTAGLMTDGVLKVGGSFSQTSGTSTQSFAPSGNHKTVLGAAAVRVVNFASPGTGAGGSHFANLDVTAATGTLQLNSNIVVDGALISLPTGTAPTIAGSGKTVTAMSLNVTKATPGSLILDNAPLIVNEQGTTRSQQFDRALFTGFPTGATSTILLDMTLVGNNAAPRSITFQAPQVQTSLGTGGLYARLVSSNTQFVTVTISGSNDPTGGPSRSNPSFGSTVNGARIVWQ